MTVFAARVRRSLDFQHNGSPMPRLAYGAEAEVSMLL